MHDALHDLHHLALDIDNRPARFGESYQTYRWPLAPQMPVAQAWEALGFHLTRNFNH